MHFVGFVRKCENVSVCVLLSFTVPSEAAMGEHVLLEISLPQPDALSAFTHWTVHSKRGETEHPSQVISIMIFVFTCFLFFLNLGRLAVRPAARCGCKAGVLRA